MEACYVTSWQRITFETWHRRLACQNAVFPERSAAWRGIAFSSLRTRTLVTVQFSGKEVILGPVNRHAVKVSSTLLNWCALTAWNMQVSSAWVDYVLTIRFTAFIPKCGNYSLQLQEEPRGTIPFSIFPLWRGLGLQRSPWWWKISVALWNVPINSGDVISLLLCWYYILYWANARRIVTKISSWLSFYRNQSLAFLEINTKLLRSEDFFDHLSTVCRVF